MPSQGRTPREFYRAFWAFHTTAYSVHYHDVFVYELEDLIHNRTSDRILGTSIFFPIQYTKYDHYNRYIRRIMMSQGLDQRLCERGFEDSIFYGSIGTDFVHVLPLYVNVPIVYAFINCNNLRIISKRIQFF